ncbi:MAG: hypothetical protein ACRCYU_23580 [Nocardioides sp.]
MTDLPPGRGPWGGVGQPRHELWQRALNDSWPPDARHIRDQPDPILSGRGSCGNATAKSGSMASRGVRLASTFSS